MKFFEKMLGVAMIGVGAYLFLDHANLALRPELPKDMPAQARFMQSGFDLSRLEAKGDWVACGVDAEQGANWCKVTDNLGTVLYQGDFLPVSAEGVVPMKDLSLRRVSPDRLFIQGPAESSPVPAIPLEGGTVLVPADDVDALAARWAQNPDELHAIAEGS